MSSEEVSKEQAEMEQQVEHFFARRLLRLESRMDSMEAKVASLGKVIRLLQHYSEKKDQQYQKEANNFHLFHSSLPKIEQLQTQLVITARKCEEISSNAHQTSIRLEQLMRFTNERQDICKTSEERLSYDIKEIGLKMERLEKNFLQQMREESRRQADAASKALPNYNIDEILFKISQMEQTHQAENDKMRAKLQRLSKKARQDEYGLSFRPSREKSKQKKSDSLLKRMKSK